ncbi:ubiquitin-like domain-containing protein [Streptomyces sp. NPDC016309]|uniref:ubiquitin-like domain-containing protein n=1 Tax=Streptomyces sp. NPDC016309 TaxID=3364965 RepID=UPI0036F9A921
MSNSQGSHRAAPRGGRHATAPPAAPVVPAPAPAPVPVGVSAPGATAGYETWDLTPEPAVAAGNGAWGPPPEPAVVAGYAPWGVPPEPTVAAGYAPWGVPPEPTVVAGYGPWGPPPEPAAPAAPHTLPRQGAGPAVDPEAPTLTAVPTGGRAQARRAARRRAAGPGTPEGLRRLVPQALVVAFLAGGTSAFVADDKAVRLTVDGVPRTMHTFADDVGELLADEGLPFGAHDLVAPAPDEALASGDEIVLRYGRPVTLTLDGQRRRIWTTARTVDEALRALGVRAEGAYLSVSRSAAITRRGLALDVRTERTVTFMADGRERTIRTNAATVREAVDQAGITLSGRDTTSVPPGSFPRDGQTITVMRITDTREVREEPIPYGVERVDDPTLYKGTEIVERQGQQGSRRVTYSLRMVNGVRQRPRKIGDEVVREPVDRRVLVGTKPMPASVDGADHLDWDALARCESGGRPDAVDATGTYGGLYQFDPGTWRSLGGTGTAQQASAAEQTYRAKKLYVQRGASPWPHCGRRLYR